MKALKLENEALKSKPKALKIETEDQCLCRLGVARTGETSRTNKQASTGLYTPCIMYG